MGYSKQWVKKINELLQTAQLTIGVLFYLKIENLEFLLTNKMSYFLFFRYVKISRSTITLKENLPHFNKFQFFWF